MREHCWSQQISRVWKPTAAPEAVNLFNQHAENILLLTDIVMSAINGTELVSKVRAIDTDLPVLLISRSADDFP